MRQQKRQISSGAEGGNEVKSRKDTGRASQRRLSEKGPERVFDVIKA